MINKTKHLSYDKKEDRASLVTDLKLVGFIIDIISFNNYVKDLV